MTRDESFMKKALAAARAAAKEGEVPVGAVIVRDGNVIATGRNRREKKKNALCHAELEAIGKACKKLGGWRLTGCTLYVTLEPCAMCYGGIVNSRVERVVFGTYDKRFGALGSMTDLSSLPFNHLPEVASGVLGKECSDLLSSFFHDLRNSKIRLKQNQIKGDNRMKTTACRLYGKHDLRLESFELPEIKPNEILAKVISDSLCMSSYKASSLGADHKRVPNDVAENPVIIGHEFCGEILQVGADYADRYRVGEKFSIQPAMNHPSNVYAAPGYSFRYIGGDATYVIIPAETLEMNCLLDYKGKAFFYGSLAEPMSCIIGAFHASYHTDPGVYVHKMGIKEGGKCAILAGVGPMGLGAVDYALHGPRKPGLLVVTDINDERLSRAESLYSVEDAAKDGIKLVFLNTSSADAVEKLMALTDGTGYDDVFVFAPVKPVVEQGDAILGKDGCLNFFAGPTDPKFSATFNFYNVHYGSTHIVGTSGGNTDDMKEALSLCEQGKINPAAMITHIGGLNAVVETTLNLPSIPGGKKLVYTHKNLPLTAISDFAEKGKESPFFAALAEIVEKNNMLWCAEAEEYLLANAPELD